MRTVLLFLLLLAASVLQSAAQSKVLKGWVKDSHTDEPIPFASVQLATSGLGALTDADGRFSITVPLRHLPDSCVFSYVGYTAQRLWITAVTPDTLSLQVALDRGSAGKEVVVRSRFSKGWILWRKVVKHKPDNDRYRFRNFGYELYNKLEIDLNRFNSKQFTRFKPLRPFGFILDQTVDSVSEDKPFLPVFLAETISNYYYQKTPLKRREEIKASRTSGLRNESVQKLLGGMDQNINVYNNYLLVFDKRFISPLSDNGDAFYHYRLTDTQFMGGKRFFHLVFTPKHKGENTFDGDCWIHDTSFAVQKMNLRLSAGANVNFIERLSLVQEYKLVEDSIWFLSKDKFIVDVSPIGKQQFGVTGRKTTTYQHVSINNSNVAALLQRNKQLEETVLLPDATDQPDQYWHNNRHEALAKNEQAIYAMIDTLQRMPLFKKYQNTVTFLATGYKAFGSLEYGPWFNVVSYNRVEGYRLRLDLGTSTNFSKKWWLRGYLAYGFGDNRLKGRAEITHLFKKNPRTRLYLNYTDDYDNGQVYYDEVSQDNIFSLAIRKPNVPVKFLRVEQERVEFLKETSAGFSVTLSATRKRFTPGRALPDKSYFVSNSKSDQITNAELAVKFRFAYMERFLEGTFLRSSLGSPYPIGEIRYAAGIPGVLGSRYRYHRLNASVSDYLKVGAIGEFYYNVFAGRIFGTLPFPLLEMHPGNEIFYYNKYAFNLMNRFEYISDRYAGINLEHNIGNGLFRLLPTRKLKLRQFWTAKLLWGNLSQANRQLNLAGSFFDAATMQYNPTTGKGWFEFQTLQDKTYMELGTGVDNIFKVLRIDLIWRALPVQSAPAIKRFGVFGSFRLQF